MQTTPPTRKRSAFAATRFPSPFRFRHGRADAALRPVDPMPPGRGSRSPLAVGVCMLGGTLPSWSDD